MSAVSQPVSAEPGSSMEEQKILGRFLRLALPWISGALDKDTYQVFFACEDRLHNLCHVEIWGVDYTILQLDLAVNIGGEDIWIQDQLDQSMTYISEQMKKHIKIEGNR